MTGYSAKVKESSRELTARERIMMKDTSNAVSLDRVLDGGELIIKPIAYAVLDIHNEKSDNVDYENYIVVAEDGTKYATGSVSFWSSFIDIWSDMDGEEEEWCIKVYKKPSKNYNGDFITCSII